MGSFGSHGGQGQTTDKNIGLIRARVIDNKDPENRCRIKVRDVNVTKDVPDKDLFWAEPCIRYFTGSNMGTFVVPPEGTLVWVMYEGLNLAQPVYMGSVLEKTKGSPDNSYREHTKGTLFLSPAGHWISYDDVTGVGYIQVTRERSMIQLTKEKITVQQGKASIVVKDDSIVLNIGGSSITMTASSININSPIINEN